MPLPLPLPTPRGGAPDSPLRRLNDASVRDAERALLTCCGSARWAHRLAAHRPYPDVEALLAAADEASYDMTHTDLAEALAGERVDQPLTEGPSALAAHTALRAAHAAYEARFGHTFVVCLDDCRAEERVDLALVGLRTRLVHDEDTERAVAAEELRRLARGRLARLLGAAPRTDPARP
ncbi:2-oxo-4-hydroxy-4-carboxy-5-ureidoimidazoline decarboxylase [Streptomyces armeniacus]|uniref:2-oxo-4-hydroxy-4-carboxy-5-ureidoimidazoline decarboxylase n=1 Tax=Streptomyces armeniacus TaxID=83291 RepID=A0A345XMN6_9ACTN|nr:2-oxo-4-hydroxy-4-carboxy-5-ureidoimidazoline decarboxylase [Streptomyces armeniacus]AXK32902.1 2-oxo-4-hydroxy-4-carboxy-5-ureidoimidazoline decarboxylase [Streptomyces armeniacus]